MTALLILDIGTTGLRAAIVDEAVQIRHLEARDVPPSTPFPGLVEFDAGEMSRLVLDAARQAMAAAGEPITAVGITNQRASTVVWDRSSGEPIGPALGWQDLRTVTECIVARAEHDLALAPNQSATKIGWLLANTPDVDGRDLCFGTVDSGSPGCSPGRRPRHRREQRHGHRLDPPRRQRLGRARVRLLGVPLEMLPAIVDTTGSVLGEATALDGSPPITSLAGDQQASLVGQGCVAPGLAKITFGTGGMLDLCTGEQTPEHRTRGALGTFPLIAWSRNGVRTWGVEAIMLSAGSNVEWLRDESAHRDERRQCPSRRRVRDHRRRGLRAGPARSRHAEMGLRRSRGAVRAHPWLDGGPCDAGGAGRRRPTRRRSRRGGRSGDRAVTFQRFASTVA